MSTPELTPSVEAAVNPPPESLDSQETVRKVYVQDVREKDRVRTVFQVTKKKSVTARSGKAFISLTLGDRTGELDGRVFDRVPDIDKTFLEGDYVLVQGNVIAFHGKPQLVVDALERLDPEPIDPAEFAVPPRPEPTPAPSRETATATENSAPAGEKSEPRSDSKPEGEPGRGAVAQIREGVERVQDPHVRALLLAFLDDPEVAKGLPVAPAAKGIHHAYRGGLADHILSVMRLAQRMADHYPMVDRDLLVAGALLHDIGKVSELSYGTTFDYTDEGRLVGHLVMTAQQIHAKASKIPGFPKLLEQHITHIVLAHHGQLEYGSPKLPMTLEAHIVHAIDSLDSRIASWLELMAKDSNPTWTEPTRLYERNLWKGPPPTARGKSPIEGRTRRPRERSRNRKGAHSTGTGPAVTPAPSSKSSPSKETGPKLSFKTFDQLMGNTPASAPESAPAVSQNADPSTEA